LEASSASFHSELFPRSRNVKVRKNLRKIEENVRISEAIF